MRKWILYILFVFSPLTVLLQASDSIVESEENVMYGKVVNGDTILHAHIRELTFFAPRKFTNQRDLRRYRRLIRNIKKVYPYAIIASDKLNEINNVMLSMKTEIERKAYVKEVEKELMAEFEGELKKLTITQGKLLIKLIDRETGNTSYELVKELRGAFSAVFWQTMARLFGSNLKTEFDAEGTDKLIDEIVIMIENGQL